jgi:hypothetical protein
MPTLINRLKIYFICTFALLTAGMLIYQYVWLEPQKRCEAGHNWWDSESRKCGTVVFVPDLTGKPLPPGVHVHRPK